MRSGKDDLALRILPGSNTFCLCLLDPVIHAVAYNMHNRILDAVYDCLVHLGILTDDGQAHVLIKTLFHIPYDTVHLLEYAGNRHHPQRHGDILQIVRKLAQLTGRFHEIVQVIPGKQLKLRGGGYHRLCNHDFSHNIHEIV